jgi:hypothetical protein
LFAFSILLKDDVMSHPQELSNAALLKAAAAVAKSDLYAMARQGLLEFGHQRFEYSTSIFDSYKSFGGEYLYDLVPRSMLGARESTPANGIFRGLSIAEMFEICFTKEALEFLLRHAYSPWRFWINVSKLISILDTSPAEEAFPFSLDFVQQRILTTNTPFGLAGSPFSDAHSAQLKALIEGMGGSLDISKLEPKVAFFLMQHGLIMHKTKPNDYREIAELVVNPLWADWLAALTAVQAEASPAVQAETSSEQKAAPTA